MKLAVPRTAAPQQSRDAAEEAPRDQKTASAA